MLPDGKTITTDYSSPRKKGRPDRRRGRSGAVRKSVARGRERSHHVCYYGRFDRGGKDIPAGNYTLFAIPGADKWTLIISKKTGEWGIPYPGEQYDFARVDMQVSKLPSSLENFTIAYDKAGGGCTLRMDWDLMRASVTFTEKK